MRGMYKYKLAVKEGSSELLLPMRSLVVKSLRRKLALNDFKLLHTFVTDVVNRSHLGDDAHANRVLEAINAKLAKEHPDYPPFQLYHLELATQRADSSFSCTFVREFNVGDNRFEKVRALYALDPQQKEKVIVIENKYQKD